MRKIIILSFMLLMCGCALIRPKYIRDNSKASVDRKEYAIVISDGIQSYQLEINNKSNNDIEIDWNKTSFIRNGHTDGNFMSSGVLYADRYNIRNPTIIMAGTNQSIDIYPNSLIYFSGQWNHLNIPDGENGVYLIFKIASKEYREKLLISRKTTYRNQIK